MSNRLEKAWFLLLKNNNVWYKTQQAICLTSSPASAPRQLLVQHEEAPLRRNVQRRGHRLRQSTVSGPSRRPRRKIGRLLHHLHVWFHRGSVRLNILLKINASYLSASRRSAGCLSGCYLSANYLSANYLSASRLSVSFLELRFYSRFSSQIMLPLLVDFWTFKGWNVLALSLSAAKYCFTWLKMLQRYGKT